MSNFLVVLAMVDDENIFSIHYFFAEGKKVERMVRNDVFWGWWVHGFSVPP